MTHGAVPAPDWFVKYRARVLGAWVALGVLGSSAVWAASWLDTAAPVFGVLTCAGLVTGVLLGVGVVTGRQVFIRKGAGSALLLHLARLAALGWQLAGIQAWDEALGLLGTGLVVLVLALQAGWLHWVSGLPDGVS